MILQPLGDRIVVEPINEQETTKAGIILPDTIDKKRPEKGRVVAVGQGRMVEATRVPLEVKVGDMVIFKTYAGDEVTVDEKEYFILSEADVLAVLQ